VQLLRGVRDSCRAQSSQLHEELARLGAEIEGAYEGLRQHPYELYAIWVHQGIAGSGHYLAYLRDWQNDRWIRFDDALVSVVAWEDVRAAAVGREGSNTSAYVLVYVEGQLATEQARPRDQAAALRLLEGMLPPQLLQEIRSDNEVVREEQAQREGRLAEQELRCHAEAIFQHYAGLVHRWAPLKRIGDNRGDPHDPVARNNLNDPALMKFELFLYRLHGEQEVLTALLTQSIEAQRAIRQWAPDDEGRVLYILAGSLRNQKCYVSMLRESPDCPGRCELVPLDMAKLSAKYNIVLTQAYVVDEVLQALKEDKARLVKAIGMLALLWARWNLQAEDALRQNEVLLIMSALIYNTVTALDKLRRSLSDSALASFQPVCEYFLLLLLSVEWPKHWKSPLILRIQGLFPQIGASMGLSKDAAGQLQHHLSLAEQKEAVLHHALTETPARWEAYELQRPEPGQEFFDRHRSLYSWVMQNDEAIAHEFVVSHAPAVVRNNEQE